MKRATISGGAFVLVLLVLAGNHRAIEQDVDARAAAPPATTRSTASTQQANQGFLFGRVTTDDRGTYEGRLRFGGEEEAFWGNYFNGVKADNPWAGRPLMARFGDIARLEARGRDLRVTLKSGTVFPLDRFAADDYADGLRVWDGRRGVVDLDEWRIRSIELLPTARLEAAPDRPHGTVRAGHVDFTGFIQWDREECVGSDQLVGQTADGELRLRFGTIGSIARRSRDSSLVTLLDGRTVVLAGTREAGRGHRGIYVDDRRYGRVLVSWDAFERDRGRESADWKPPRVVLLEVGDRHTHPSPATVKTGRGPARTRAAAKRGWMGLTARESALSQSIRPSAYRSARDLATQQSGALARHPPHRPARLCVWCARQPWGPKAPRLALIPAWSAEVRPRMS